MKTLILAIALFLPTAAFSHDLSLGSSQSNDANHPTKFSIKHKAKSLVRTFYIEGEDLPLGKVIKESPSQEIFFHYMDDQDKLLATGKTHKLKEDKEIEVYSSTNTLLATIKRETFSVRPVKFQIEDPNHKVLAVAEMNWLGTRFTLTSPTNKHKEFAIFTRPYYKMINDYWHVKIEDHKAIDPVVLVILATYQSDLDTKHGELR